MLRGMDSPPALARRRPAEVSTATAAALALVASRLFGFFDDAELMAAVTVLVGLVPGAVTWLVEWRRQPKGP